MLNKIETMPTYKVIEEHDGKRYKFYCDLSGELLCTTKPYKADTPEKELMVAWNAEGKAHFNVCHKCGKFVSDAMFNVDVLECVECSPFEAAPKFCKKCGVKIEENIKFCTLCGTELVFGTVTSESTSIENQYFKNMEEFGFGPNVMKKHKVCSECGKMVDAKNEICFYCKTTLPEETLYDRYKQKHSSCPKCDTILTVDSQYCPTCGNKMN